MNLPGISCHDDDDFARCLLPAGQLQCEEGRGQTVGLWTQGMPQGLLLS